MDEQLDEKEQTNLYFSLCVYVCVSCVLGSEDNLVCHSSGAILEFSSRLGCVVSVPRAPGVCQSRPPLCWTTWRHCSSHQLELPTEALTQKIRQHL